MQALRLFGRGLKWGALGGITAGSLMYLHRNNWDVSQTGVVRIGRAAVACGSIIVDYKKTFRKHESTSPEYEKALSDAHWRSAEKLRNMCCANGGVFIKVGQHVGAMEYLLPMEYVETMKVLHSNAPQSSIESLKAVVKQDLNRDLDEIFDDFDPEPLGTASLAQVHKAKLKDGTVVAVKIQHPNVKAHSYIDTKAMEFLVHLVKRLFPEFRFVWLVKEMKINLPNELDFLNEGRNAVRIARMLSKFEFLKVPTINWELSTERVLTMEYCEGGQINDKEYFDKNSIPVNEVSENLGKLYSEMIFVQGYVHCDPHPGNVLVKKTDKGTQIVMLDHGLYQTLSDEFRMNYCKLWMGLIKNNMDDIKYYSQQMNAGDLYPLFACMLTARSWQAVSSGLDKKKYTNQEEDEIKQEISKYLPEISKILDRVPRQMILLFKTNDLLRGIETNLKTRASSTSFITMSRACIRAEANDLVKKCDTFWCRSRVSMNMQWTLFKVYLYELYLWFDSSSFARLLKRNYLLKSL